MGVIQNEPRTATRLDAWTLERGDRAPPAWTPRAGGGCVRDVVGAGRVFLGLWIAAACVFGVLPRSRAALQFDVFVGYDNTVHEASWFPVACEIFNDGPSFNGIFELSNDNFGRSQTRRYTLELPTNTRKRFSIPVFASAGRYSRWTARLYDEKGKLRGEQPNLQPQDKTADTRLLGALPRSYAGVPVFPEIKQKQDELQPRAVRLMIDQFPDNPLCLEGLDSIYLNSEKALELSAVQARALVTWLYSGGQLILAVEQPGDVNGTPWLRALVGGQIGAVDTVRGLEDLQRWIETPVAVEPTRPIPGMPTQFPSPAIQRRYGLPPPPNAPVEPVERPEMTSFAPNVPRDYAFDKGVLPVANATLPNMVPLLDVGKRTIAWEGARGRGSLAVLLFSPEREPFRSWKNAPWFWVRLTDMPGMRFVVAETSRWGGQSIDAVFGAMIDSRQVRKLPVGWLLVLLVVYLVVIGPFDHYILKRLNRQMWTWVTFPLYVALFSTLIYFIGYKLRAGESEWNELNVVDVLVLPKGTEVQLRGRTFASVYSPVNARYALESTQPHATLRGEFQGSRVGSQEASRADVVQRNEGYRAEVFVPVWTSQLFVTDWLETTEPPITAQIRYDGAQYELTVVNRLPSAIAHLSAGIGDRLFEAPGVPAGQEQRFTFSAAEGVLLTSLADRARNEFFTAAQTRGHALGSTAGGRLDCTPGNVVAASLLASPSESRLHPQFFLAPRGLGVMEDLKGNNMVLFAWVPNYAAGDPIHRFVPRRLRRDTMFRLTVPVPGRPGAAEMAPLRSTL